jgi:hypothetical protein
MKTTLIKENENELRFYYVYSKKCNIKIYKYRSQYGMYYQVIKVSVKDV